MEKKKFTVSKLTEEWINLYLDISSLQDRVSKRLEEFYADPDKEFNERFSDGFLMLFDGVQHMIGESAIARLCDLNNIKSENVEI